MESHGFEEKVSFRVLRTRLLALVHARIQSGDFTERALARILGISQPQIHNVLKGRRRLRPELADRLISMLNLSVLDLLEHAELQNQLLSRREADPWDGPSRMVGSHVTPKRLVVEKKPAGRQDRSAQRVPPLAAR